MKSCSFCGEEFSDEAEFTEGGCCQDCIELLRDSAAGDLFEDVDYDE
jgi:hypothetical protein